MSICRLHNLNFKEQKVLPTIQCTLSRNLTLWSMLKSFFSAIQYTPSANLTLSIARKRFSKKILQNDSKLDIKVDISLYKSIHNQILQTIGYVLRVEEKHLRLRNSNYYPYENDAGLLDFLEGKCALGEAEKYQASFIVYKN